MDTRRDFLKAVGLGTAALIVPGCASAVLSSADDRSRPNIIFIMSDDHAAQTISCYGSRINRTPNIDRLAKEGMLFQNCFCVNSICTPSRANILTGKHSHKNGCMTLSNKFDGSQQTFPKLLQQAGYHTGVVGKWHLKTQPTGFDYFNVLPGQGLYFDPYFREKGKPWRNKRKFVQHKGYVTDIITDMALDFLKERPKDKPFCLLYQHKAPHDMWEYDEKHAHMYADVDIPEPDNLFDDFQNRGEAIKRATLRLTMEQGIFLHPTQGKQFDNVRKEIGHLPEKQQVRRVYQYFIKAYLRCVASIDDNIGRVLDYLDRSGLAENTIVVYTSDQGVFLGEHGLFDKRFMYEESLRMPFLVRYPREVKPARVTDDIITNVDFAETFLDYAQVPIPDDMQGRSIRPLLAGKTPRNWPKSAYYRYWMHRAHFNVAAHFGVRTKRYKLIYYHGQGLGVKGAKNDPTPPEWELFDLKKDPKEMENVYDDAAYARIVRKLKAELIKLRIKLEDDKDGIVVE